MLRLALVTFVTLLGLAPAAAQTDDLILNDVVALLADIAEAREMAALCATATGGDPAVAASFEAYGKRNTSWAIVSVALIGSRGGLDPAVVEQARDQEIENLRYRFANDTDAARTCRDFAHFADTFESDVASGQPEVVMRLMEARDGKRPPIDVDAVPEVTDAMAVRALFQTQQKLLLACSSRMRGDKETYLEAFRTWSSRNFDDDMNAGVSLLVWGAMAPWRAEWFDKAAQAAASLKVELATDAGSTCATLLAAVADGSADLASQLPGEVARLREADGKREAAEEF